jgi:hypothetical protein
MNIRHLSALIQLLTLYSDMCKILKLQTFKSQKYHADVHC